MQQEAPFLLTLHQRDNVMWVPCAQYVLSKQKHKDRVDFSFNGGGLDFADVRPQRKSGQKKKV